MHTDPKSVDSAGSVHEEVDESVVVSEVCSEPAVSSLDVVSPEESVVDSSVDEVSLDSVVVSSRVDCAETFVANAQANKTVSRI